MSVRSVLIAEGCCALLALAPIASASETGQRIADRISPASYQHYLNDLLYTHDGNDREAFFGPDHDAARENIVAVLTGFGLDVQIESFTYSGYVCHNVVATQAGTAFPEACYIIGAHYDSAGTPGADDNASGVAGVMEVARVISQCHSDYTIKYIAFDTEEYGLLGSQAYVDAHPGDDIRGMISMDMIAHDNGSNSAFITGFAACGLIKNALGEALAAYGNGLGATFGTEVHARSDHGPFQAAGFQACLLIEAGFDYNPCYHTPCDSVDTTGYINHAFAVKMTRGVAGFLADNAAVRWPFDCADMSGCDAADHGGEDCNANGVWDLCDIACGASSDVNGNGVPDECDPHETWYVDATNIPGPGSGTQADPFCRIQDAINAASSDSGAFLEIVVTDGIYAGPGNKNLDLGGKPILLHSVGGAASCLIDCEDSGRGFYFHGGESGAARVIGFTIKNGRVGSDSEGGANGAGVYCAFSGAVMSDCVIGGNTAYSGGGVYCTGSNSRLTLINCTIAGNTAAGAAARGGGVYCYNNAKPTLINCVIIGNTAWGSTSSSGGGVCCYYFASPAIINCTISGNAADGTTAAGGALGCLYYSSPRLTNCILWDDWPQEISASSIPPGVSYCNIMGGWPGEGNIDSNPVFVDAINGDYHLRERSPCIDAGNNLAVPPDILTDIDGQPRVGRGRPLHIVVSPEDIPPPPPPVRVDMGADEFKLVLPEPEAVLRNRSAAAATGGQ